MIDDSNPTLLQYVVNDVAGADVKAVIEAVVEKVTPLRLPLINRFYEQCRYRAKCSRADVVFSFQIGAHIIAAARLLPQANGVFLLRSLCVAPEYRQQGIATRFIAVILQQIAPYNCYCFSLIHLQKFYQQLGFTKISAEQAPLSIAELSMRYQSRGRDWILMGFNNSHHK